MKKTLDCSLQQSASPAACRAWTMSFSGRPAEANHLHVGYLPALIVQNVDLPHAGLDCSQNRVPEPQPCASPRLPDAAQRDWSVPGPVAPVGLWKCS